MLIGLVHCSDGGVVLFYISGGGCNGGVSVRVQVLVSRCPGVTVVVVSVPRSW